MHDQRGLFIDGNWRTGTAKGEPVLANGKRHGNVGYFREPTVMVDIPDDADIPLSESFGPIAPILPYADLDEAIEKANALSYGLAAYAFTQSAETAERRASEIAAGGGAIDTAAPMYADTPFGGVKDSGIGYEGGIEGIDAYLYKKMVSRGAREPVKERRMTVDIGCSSVVRPS